MESLHSASGSLSADSGPDDAGQGEDRSPYLYSFCRGQGPAVILAHGLGGSHHEWAALMEALVEAGYRACAVDLFGHGESQKSENPIDYQAGRLLQSFESWIAGLALDHPPVLIGHSLGGYLALAYALRYPAQVQALVLLSPFYSPEQQLSRLMNRLRRRPRWGVKALQAAPEWLMHILVRLDPSDRRRLPPQVCQQVARDLKQAAPHIMHIPDLVSDLAGSLPQVEPPTLVVWGDRDMTLKPATFPFLARNLPHAVARSIPGGGHQPHLGHPELVARWVLEFLESLPDLDAGLSQLTIPGSNGRMVARRRVTWR